MKAKKRVLSTILSLSSILLVGCNKKTTSSSSCSITTSTPTIDSTPEPTPTKTVEELNKELFDNYAIFATYAERTDIDLFSFKDEIPEEYLNLETIIIPEETFISGQDGVFRIIEIENSEGGLFSKFTKVKKIVIPASITRILFSNASSKSSPFIYLPNLESIEVDGTNEYFYTKGNCLIRKSDNTIICGWKNVEIPEEITTIRSYAFSNNQSITTIKLNEKANFAKSSFSYLDNLSNIDINGNITCKSEPNTNVIYFENVIYAAWGVVTIPSSIVSPVLDGYSSVTSVTLHDSVTTLSANAFRGTKIKNLKIPASVNSIHLLAFNELTDIEDIQIDNNNQTYEIVNNCIFDRYNGNNFVAIYYAYGDAAIPDYKVTLGADALQGSYSLSSLTLHNKFTSLSLNSFRLLPSTDKFTTIKFKGTIAEFKEMKQYASFYDTLKDRTTLNVEFLESTDGINWTVKETYKMSELESINIE